MQDATLIEKAYTAARDRYAAWDVDTDAAIAALAGIPLSLHCWQGDDVGGFEKGSTSLEGGGIQVTGNYPGKARTPDELRTDLEKTYSLIPGRHRLNLHAIYGEFGGKKIDRDAIETAHFAAWIDWARDSGLGIDFNCTCFSHPLADSGFTLSHRDAALRSFWIEHATRCRAISADIGRALGNPCIHNLWIPDGSKDTPADRFSHRAILKESLDAIYSVEHDPAAMKDSLESKLFGIGSESFVTGSHEFYMGYALTRGKMLCLDMGHFHPTESVADKISALLQFCGEIMLHVSRGVRWDSDHVVTLNDEVLLLAAEVVRCRALDRVHVGLDFFDASIHRVGAWVVGARATQKAFLAALLEPLKKLAAFEESGDLFSRLATMEEGKTMPFGAVWDYHCLKEGVPAGDGWIEEIRRYEADVTSRRT
jgi:L-rhamnose isomerase